MRNGENCALVCGKIVLKPAEGFKIEVVCGLVKHEQIRVLKQQLCKGKARTFAARKALHRRFGVKGAKAHTREHGVYFYVYIIAVCRFKAAFFVLIFRKKACVLCRAVLKACHIVLKGAQVLLRFEHGGENRAHFGNYRSAKGKAAVLPEKAYALSRSAGKGSAVVIHIAGYNIKQSGFARSVFAYKTYSVFVFNL